MTSTYPNVFSIDFFLLSWICAIKFRIGAEDQDSFFCLLTFVVHPVREQGEKVTKIWPRRYLVFHNYWCFKISFPKKLNYFIYANFFYKTSSEGYFSRIFTLIWEYIGGLKMGGCKNSAIYVTKRTYSTQFVLICPQGVLRNGLIVFLYIFPFFCSFHRENMEFLRKIGDFYIFFSYFCHFFMEKSDWVVQIVAYAWLPITTMQNNHFHAIAHVLYAKFRTKMVKFEP